MTRTLSTTARARRLRLELKRLRNAAGLSTDAAGGRVGLSGPTISRIENGKRSASVDEVERFLDLYNVPVVRQRELLDLAERSHERGWWQAYAGQISEDAQTIIALEEEATKITNFQLILVPGLLQTAEYARAVLQADDADHSREVEAKVAARMARQSILTRPNAPELHVILDESALRRHRDPDIMRRQLNHLVESASRPNITLQVIPFSAGPHDSTEGSCVVFEFGDDPAIVLLEGKLSDLFLEEPEEIVTYRETVQGLLRVALTPDESVEFIDHLSKEFT